MQIPFFKALIFLMLLVSCSAFAQNITLKGKVVDAETNQPVEFANLGIVNSFVGTATDFNGDFELMISEDFKTYTVRISAVGYRTKEISAEELISENGVQIKLFPQSYGIGQVEIKAESKRLYGVLKTASNMIEDNYMDPYGAKVYFVQVIDGSKKSEIALDFFDRDGYGERSFSNALEKRGYQISEVRRNYEQNPIIDGLIRADDILEFDIARIRGNVLDASIINEFSLELVEETVYNNDSVWVIKYKLDHPGFAETGDEQVISYAGIVYVSIADYAILRNELEVVTKGYHVAGRSAGLSSEPGENYSYKVNSIYRKVNNDKYALSKIEYKGDGVKSIEMTWVVYDYFILEGTATLDREYYTSQQTNPDFWERFELPK